MVPFGLGKKPVEGSSLGEQAESSHFSASFIVPLAIFLEKDPKLPYV